MCRLSKIEKRAKSLHPIVHCTSMNAGSLNQTKCERKFNIPVQYVQCGTQKWTEEMGQSLDTVV